jgi:hypothetical protein
MPAPALFPPDLPACADSIEVLEIAPISPPRTTVTPGVLYGTLRTPGKCYSNTGRNVLWWRPDTMKRMTLRLSDALHSALKQLSMQENRSLHGEILHLLKLTVGTAPASQQEEELDAE